VLTRNPLKFISTWPSTFEGRRSKHQRWHVKAELKRRARLKASQRNLEEKGRQVPSENQNPQRKEEEIKEREGLLHLAVVLPQVQDLVQALQVILQADQAEVPLTHQVQGAHQVPVRLVIVVETTVNVARRW